MFEHQNATGSCQCQRATRAAFADNDRHKRHAQLQAFIRAACNGFGLSALFGTDTRISPGRIDQRDDRQVETLGHIHNANGLTVPFGPRHAEIVLQPVLRI